MNIQEATITNIEPVFNFENVSGGYFRLFFNNNFNDSFQLSFAPFLDYFIKRDAKLFEYIKNNHNNKTISHAISDLYDLGIPIDQWVSDYFEMVKSQTDTNLVNALVQFYLYMKNFNSSGSADFDDYV